MYSTMFFYDGTQTSREFIFVYSWWASVMILQLLSFSWFTGRTRVRCEVIHSEEDRMWFDNRKIKLYPKGDGHPDVDQIRSGHFNDLSIIIPYLIIVPIWLNSEPSQLIVNILLRLFPIAKIINTLLYMGLIKSPNICRIIVLTISYAILVFISVSNIIHFYK